MTSTTVCLTRMSGLPSPTLRRCIVLALMLPAVLVGCATRLSETPAPVSASDKHLGEFDRVLLVNAELAPPDDVQGANRKAARRVDALLARGIGPLLNDVEVHSPSQVAAMDLAGTDTLLIRPLIKQIKFINVGARIVTGPLSGSGVIVVDTRFEDAASGRALAEPGYYRKAGAWASTFSSADNRMLTAVAKDIADYTRRNRCAPGMRWRAVDKNEPPPDPDNWRPIERHCEPA